MWAGKVKRSGQVGRKVRASEAEKNALWEYKTGTGLKVHPFYFSCYPNQPGQMYVISF